MTCLYIYQVIYLFIFAVPSSIRLPLLYQISLQLATIANLERLKLFLYLKRHCSPWYTVYYFIVCWSQRMQLQQIRDTFSMSYNGHNHENKTWAEKYLKCPLTNIQFPPLSRTSISKNLPKASHNITLFISIPLLNLLPSRSPSIDCFFVFLKDITTK